MGNSEDNIVVPQIVKYAIAILSIVVLILILISFIFIGRFFPEDSGRQTDNYILQAIDGKTLNLYDILDEKSVVLLFWTTWCPFCVKELPEIEKFYLLNRKKVTVIAINVGEEREKVEEFINKNNISFPVVLDIKGEIRSFYKVVGVPTIFYVNTQKKIGYHGHSFEEMREEAGF